jgi:hypothetical protein
MEATIRTAYATAVAEKFSTWTSSKYLQGTNLKCLMSQGVWHPTSQGFYQSAWTQLTSRLCIRSLNPCSAQLPHHFSRCNRNRNCRDFSHVSYISFFFPLTKYALVKVITTGNSDDVVFEKLILRDIFSQVATSVMSLPV